MSTFVIFSHNECGVAYGLKPTAAAMLLPVSLFFLAANHSGEPCFKLTVVEVEVAAAAVVAMTAADGRMTGPSFTV